jgi:hypothetical protein
MIDKQKLITWMELNGSDFYQGSYDAWLKEFHRAIESGDLDYKDTCKWVLKKQKNLGGVMPCIVNLYESPCVQYLLVEKDGDYCTHCRKEIELVEND